jgi:hypothetical protein
VSLDRSGRRPAGTARLDGDWGGVVALCRAVEAALPQRLPEIVDHIRSEIPAYASIAREEHERGVREQCLGLLEGLETCTAPTVEQIGPARALGRQRAREGLPVEAMIDAYHIGYHDMWEIILEKSDASDADLTAQLLQVVNWVWTWIRHTSSAAADAYAGIVRSQQTVQINLTHRLLEALRSGEAGSDEAVRLARALAFDPDQTFQAVSTPTNSWSAEKLDLLQRGFDFQRGTIRSAARGPFAIVLFQDVSAAVVVSAIHKIRPSLPIGIGLPRQGLGGAKASIVDAEQALAVAEKRGEVVEFGDQWLQAIIGTQRHRLAPVLRSDEEISGVQPHLAEAVASYAAEGFSAAAAARALHIHPNTMSYRLDRWYQLTGWDPRTLDGLLRSVLHLSLRA